MEDLITNIGPQATTLVAIVAGLVQQIKRHPGLAKLQEKLPFYQLMSLGLGVGGAYLMGMGNPVFAGIIIGLSASGAYDIVK